MRHTDKGSGSTTSTGTRIGYTRVSTVAQTLDQQNEALGAAGVAKVFSDVMSGARDDRPGLADLLAYVREGRHGRGVEVGPAGPQHIAHPGDGQGVDRPERHPDLHH